jgi:hypothetical protein
MYSGFSFMYSSLILIGSYNILGPSCIQILFSCFRVLVSSIRVLGFQRTFDCSLFKLLFLLGIYHTHTVDNEHTVLADTGLFLGSTMEGPFAASDMHLLASHIQRSNCKTTWGNPPFDGSGQN